MAPLTQQEQEFVRLVAREVAEEHVDILQSGMQKFVRREVETHERGCPLKTQLAVHVKTSRLQMFVVAIIGGLIGGSLARVPELFKLIEHAALAAAGR